MGVFAGRDFLDPVSVQDDLQCPSRGDLGVECQPLVFAVDLETEIIRGLETDPAIKPLAVNDQRHAARCCVIVAAIAEKAEDRLVRSPQAQVNVLSPVEHGHLRTHTVHRFFLKARIEDRRNRPPLIEDKGLGFVVHPVVEDARGSQALPISQHVGSVHIGEPELSRVRSRLVRREPDGKRPGRIAGDEFPLVADAVRGVADGMHATLQVELAAVVLRVLVPQLDEQVAEGLIRAHIPFIPGPERFLVELDPLVVGLPEDHRPKLPVADRQRLSHPIDGGFVVPEFGIGGLSRCGHRGRQREGDECVLHVCCLAFNNCSIALQFL